MYIKVVSAREIILILSKEKNLVFFDLNHELLIIPMNLAKNLFFFLG